MRPKIPYNLTALIIVLAAPGAAQVGPLTDPPNAATGGGVSVGGAYSLSNIESVNSLNGNLNLSIPLAHLPTGPGGFSAGVNLVYNSANFDIQTEVPTDNSSVLQMKYVPSAHGGGWGYSYKYTLWSQTRVSVFNSVTCSAVSTLEARAWYKNFLQTPDGANHALHRWRTRNCHCD